MCQKVLTETLRDFEVHGLIERRDYRTVPPKVNYRLTALGESLAEALAVIDQSVIAHFFDMARARKQYLRKKRRTAAADQTPRLTRVSRTTST